METSYFGKYKELKATKKRLVSVSRWSPRYWGKRERALELAPTAEMLKKGYTFDEYNEKILAKLDPQEIYNKYKDAVLLCYEKDREECHRKDIAVWLGKNLKKRIKEIK